MSLLAYSFIVIIQKISWFIYILITIRVILSWMPNINNNFTELIYSLTEPLLKPFKDLLDKYINLPIDFSPLLLILFIELVEKILIRLILLIFY